MSAGKSIVVADDEQQLALAIKIRLESKGFVVRTASDGLEALKLIAEQMPDLVLLDVMMPGMDGYSCARELNTKYGRGKVPVIVLTARDRMKDLFELEGIEDYIVKPFDHDDLLLRIERVFKRRATKAASTPTS